MRLHNKGVSLRSEPSRVPLLTCVSDTGGQIVQLIVINIRHLQSGQHVADRLPKQVHPSKKVATKGLILFFFVETFAIRPELSAILQDFRYTVMSVISC